jgi:hypothetical protein
MQNRFLLVVLCTSERPKSLSNTDLGWNQLRPNKHGVSAPLRKCCGYSWSTCCSVRPLLRLPTIVLHTPLIFDHYRQVGFAFFSLGSVLSTAAQNMPMVLAGRGLSGVGAAFLLVVSVSPSAPKACIPLTSHPIQGCTRHLCRQPFFHYEYVENCDDLLALRSWLLRRLVVLTNQAHTLPRESDTYFLHHQPIRADYWRCTFLSQFPVDIRYQFASTYKSTMCFFHCIIMCRSRN